MQKLFKGGNYSRAETIRGNTVFRSLLSPVFEKLIAFMKKKMTCHQNLYKMAAEFFKNSTRILFGKTDGISSIDSIFAKFIP